MQSLLVVLLSFVSIIDAFSNMQSSSRLRSELSMIAPKPSGFSNTKAGKAVIIERTKKLVDNSAFIIALPVDRITKEQIDNLRKELPEGAKASVVKNAILKLVIRSTPFEPLSEHIRDKTIYLFIPEGQAKATYAGFKKWKSENKRGEEEVDLKFGALDGVFYPGDQLETAAALPTRKDLIIKLTSRLRSIPKRLASTLRATPNKLVRTFSALKAKKEEAEKPKE